MHLICMASNKESENLSWPCKIGNQQNPWYWNMKSEGTHILHHFAFCSVLARFENFQEEKNDLYESWTMQKVYIQPNMLCLARFETWKLFKFHESPIEQKVINLTQYVACGQIWDFFKLCESLMEPKVLNSTRYAVSGQIWKFFNFCESSAFDPICCAWPDL